MKIVDDVKKYFTKRKSAKDKKVADEIKAPYIKVIKIGFQEDDPTKGGYFELDWNDDFVGLLGEAGYSGPNPEAIVDLWFNDLCRSIVLEQELEGRPNVPGNTNQRPS